MILIWSNDSVEDLESIRDFIARDSEFYARVFIERIIDKVEHLVDFPLSGRVVPELNNGNIREIIYRDYRIIYEVEETRVIMLSVLHGSRLLDTGNKDL